MTSSPITSTMQPTPVDAALFPDRAVVILSGALHLRLAALLGRGEVYEAGAYTRPLLSST